MTALPRIKPVGPSPTDILIIGDAPGGSEVLMNYPFVGSSGQELQKMCKEAGINYATTYRTYVSLSQPPKNDINYFTVPTKLATPPSRGLGMVSKGKYANDFLIDELARLHQEISAISPKVIIALGNLALWALTGKTGIGAYRGVAEPYPPNPSITIIPTYHPAAVLRNWQMRAIVVADLSKAARYLSKSESPEPDEILSIKINPTLQEIAEFVPLAQSAKQMAIDVETKASQIRTISFTISPSSAFVVPFWDTDIGNYWKTDDEETLALTYVREILQSPADKIFQNGAYDIQYIWKTWGIPIAGVIHDTMLLHHALQPELQKSLGFLGSIYLDRAAWKQWRKEHAEKKDD